MAMNNYLNQYSIYQDEYQKQKYLEAYAKQIEVQRNVAGLLGGAQCEPPMPKPEEPNLVLLLEDV